MDRHRQRCLLHRQKPLPSAWPGMRAESARRRCPALTACLPDHDRYRAAQEALLDVAYDWSPCVAGGAARHLISVAQHSCGATSWALPMRSSAPRHCRRLRRRVPTTSLFTSTRRRRRYLLPGSPHGLPADVTLIISCRRRYRLERT